MLTDLPGQSDIYVICPRMHPKITALPIFEVMDMCSNFKKHITEGIVAMSGRFLYNYSRDCPKSEHDFGGTTLKVGII